jgi:hypothetical protein
MRVRSGWMKRCSAARGGERREIVVGAQAVPAYVREAGEQLRHSRCGWEQHQREELEAAERGEERRGWFPALYV